MSRARYRCAKVAGRKCDLFMGFMEREEGKQASNTAWRSGSGRVDDEEDFGLRGGHGRAVQPGGAARRRLPGDRGRGARGADGAAGGRGPGSLRLLQLHGPRARRSAQGGGHRGDQPLRHPVLQLARLPLADALRGAGERALDDLRRAGPRHPQHDPGPCLRFAGADRRARRGDPRPAGPRERPDGRQSRAGHGGAGLDLAPQPARSPGGAGGGAGEAPSARLVPGGRRLQHVRRRGAGRRAARVARPP